MGSRRSDSHNDRQNRFTSFRGRHLRGPHTLHTKKKSEIMTASKGESPSCTEKRKSWANIIKRTLSFSNLSRRLSINDKDNINGNNPAVSSSTALTAKSQSKFSIPNLTSRRGSLESTTSSTKRGSLDSTGSISSFNNSYSSRSSQTPPQEFWW